jgi:DNA-binding CsgD family transcriptional regulator
MSMRATEGYRALTEKEKQTLRLIVRGHDAESIARNLDLSVHTINERLRDARRKMSVSSSREAARMLLDTEGGDHQPFGPNSLGDTKIGEAAARLEVQQEGTPTSGVGRHAASPGSRLELPS